jgi:hypothetical protein
LTKNSQLRVEEKKLKKETTSQNTVLTPTCRQKPTLKAQRRRVCVSTSVRCNEKKTVLWFNERSKKKKIITFDTKKISISLLYLIIQEKTLSL